MTEKRPALDHRPPSDLRDEFIKQVVRGRSFAEVGGLWGTVNERVSVAHRHGAVGLAMIDVTPEGGELWTLFGQRLKLLGVEEKCEFHVRDACEPFDRRWDVVHCSGVLYHHPHPLNLLVALRDLAARHLILTSAVTRERIENEHGEYEVPPSGVVFVPALSAAERAVLGAYWGRRRVVAHGVTEPASYDTTDFGPWWFLPTPTALMAMARSCGMQVVESGPIWNDDAYTLLLDTQRG